MSPQSSSIKYITCVFTVWPSSFPLCSHLAPVHFMISPLKIIWYSILFVLCLLWYSIIHFISFTLFLRRIKLSPHTCRIQLYTITDITPTETHTAVYKLVFSIKASEKVFRLVFITLLEWKSFLKCYICFMVSGRVLDPIPAPYWQRQGRPLNEPPSKWRALWENLWASSLLKDTSEVLWRCLGTSLDTFRVLLELRTLRFSAQPPTDLQTKLPNF